MKAQGAVLRSTMGLGPFLTLILLSRPARFEDELSKVNGDVTSVASATIHSAAEAEEAYSSQVAMVNPGPILKLLMMLRSPRSCHDGARWQGATLPPGCVMAVRYVSR
jgi:hypothetical protein